MTKEKEIHFSENIFRSFMIVGIIFAGIIFVMEIVFTLKHGHRYVSLAGHRFITRQWWSSRGGMTLLISLPLSLLFDFIVRKKLSMTDKAIIQRTKVKFKAIRFENALIIVKHGLSNRIKKIIVTDFNKEITIDNRYSKYWLAWKEVANNITLANPEYIENIELNAEIERLEAKHCKK
jgi:hypothetical protein